MNFSVVVFICFLSLLPLSTSQSYDLPFYKSEGYSCQRRAERVLNKLRISQPILPVFYYSASKARSMLNPLGCKFPFHNALFLFCRNSLGDWSHYVKSQMLKAASSFNSCINQPSNRTRYIKCWVEAEKKHACKHSHTGRYWQIKFNGKVW